MVSVPTGNLVCLQNVQYPKGVVSFPTESLACVQDYRFYRIFSVLTGCSVPIQVFSVPRVFSMPTG
jgi:hypothetical protein